MLLDRMKLLQKEELKIKKVELGGDDFVFVRQMTGRERDRFERSLFREITDKKGNVTYKQSLEDFRAKLVVNVVCDEQGTNLLQPSDYDVLSQHMSAAKLEKIVEIAQELNKITDADKEKLVKNSESGQKDEDTSESGALSADSPTPTTGSIN